MYDVPQTGRGNLLLQLNPHGCLPSWLALVRMDIIECFNNNAPVSGTNSLKGKSIMPLHQNASA